MDQAAGGTAVDAVQRSAADADALVVQVLQRHADTLLRVARRHSLCDEDAADAYQRSLEIFLGHARRLEAETAHRWLFRVVRNEAVTVREQRQRFMGPVPVEPDEIEARTTPSPEEQALARERLAQAAEALAALKDDELQALWMQASGHSYTEIAEGAGWTRTKVNRALVEGRRRLFAEREAIDSGRACARWEPVLDALASGGADPRQLQEMRLHLRHCAACQRVVRGIHRSGTRAAALLPLGLLAGDSGDLPGVVLGGGAGGAEGAVAWISRVHDVVAGHLQERAALSLMKVQAAADVLSAGKVAAVAASAAALAGGGAVAVHERGVGRHEQAEPTQVHARGRGEGGEPSAGGRGRAGATAARAGGRTVVVAGSGGGWPLSAGRGGGEALAGGVGAGAPAGGGAAAGAGGAAAGGGGAARTVRTAGRAGARREWREPHAAGASAVRELRGATPPPAARAPVAAPAPAARAPVPAAGPEVAGTGPVAPVAARGGGEFHAGDRRAAGSGGGPEFTP